MSTKTKALLLLTFCLTTAILRAHEMTVELDPSNTKIQFTLGATLHSVHGTFALKSGTIHFDPSTGAASGLVVVDVTSAETGNDGRDHKMHKEVLQSQRYPEATFIPSRFSGTFSPMGNSMVQLDGILKLHGTDHPVTLSAPVQVNGNIASAKANLVIPYVEWGLKNPSTLFLHVSEKVDVEISAAGHLLPQ